MEAWADNVKDVCPCRSRATSEACLSHPWLQLIQSAECGEAPQLPAPALAKDNHSLQRTAWNNRDSNYYLFDYKSRTASQLYEMNLTLDPKKMQMTETMEVGEGEEVREDSADTFSFFTPDGLVRRDSELKVDAEGKISVRDSEGVMGDTASLRKRSLDAAPPRVEVTEPGAAEEAGVEYVGLVKRPKTPLITSRDIEQQAAAIAERKQSGCGSLPDLISSSLDTTELHASRSVTINLSRLEQLETKVAEDYPKFYNHGEGPYYGLHI